MELELYQARDRRREGKSQRSKKKHLTTQAQARVNDRNSKRMFRLKAVENFASDDTFLTITFAVNTSDDQRVKIVRSFVRFLQKKEKLGQLEKPVKYIYVIGRGRKERNLHAHMLLNIHHTSSVFKEFMSKCSGAYIHGDLIKEIKHMTREQAITDRVGYMFDHVKQLTEEDKNTFVKKKFYASQNLDKPVISAEVELTEAGVPYKVAQMLTKHEDEHAISYIGSFYEDWQIYDYDTRTIHSPLITLFPRQTAIFCAKRRQNILKDMD